MKESKNITFGQRLRQIREAQGYSLKALAEAADIAGGATAISRLETGVSQPLLATLQKLAKALRVSLTELDYPWRMPAKAGKK